MAEPTTNGERKPWYEFPEEKLGASCYNRSLL